MYSIKYEINVFIFLTHTLKVRPTKKDLKIANMTKIKKEVSPF